MQGLKRVCAGDRSKSGYRAEIGFTAAISAGA